ncbi:MAG: hypothetical protein CSA81_04735 [Acidobacteria bacterium]|nr:MAG: hypothetical protein CSA81_04735 [Acidobacteriota bacterium]
MVAMYKDEILEEIWKIRDEHAKKFNYDLKLIARDLKKIEQECDNPVITKPLKTEESKQAK